MIAIYSFGGDRRDANKPLQTRQQKPSACRTRGHLESAKIYRGAFGRRAFPGQSGEGGQNQPQSSKRKVQTGDWSKFCPLRRPHTVRKSARAAAEFESSH